MGKNRMEDEVVEEKKPYNKFQWFLIAIIPVFFTIFILLIVLTIAGVNVFQWSKEVGSNIPVVSTLFKEAEEPSLDEMNGEIVDLKGEIKNREAQIAQLESELERGAEEKEQLIEEMQALEKEIEAFNIAPEAEEDKQAFKDIIRTYESMSAKKAAAIISALDDADAVQILSNVKADSLAAILEKMEPENAARLTKQLANASE